MCIVYTVYTVYSCFNFQLRRILYWWRTAILIPHTQKISFEQFTVVTVNAKIDSYFLNNLIPLKEFEEITYSWDNCHSMINTKNALYLHQYQLTLKKEKCFLNSWNYQPVGSSFKQSNATDRLSAGCGAHQKHNTMLRVKGFTISTTKHDLLLVELWRDFKTSNCWKWPQTFLFCSACPLDLPVHCKDQ